MMANDPEQKNMEISCYLEAEANADLSDDADDTLSCRLVIAEI